MGNIQETEYSLSLPERGGLQVEALRSSYREVGQRTSFTMPPKSVSKQITVGVNFSEGLSEVHSFLQTSAGNFPAEAAMVGRRHHAQMDKA